MTTDTTTPPDAWDDLPRSTMVDAWVDLRAEVKGVGQQLADEQARRAREQPVRGPLQASGTVPASGPLVLDLGLPAMGHRWNLRNISVTAAAGVRTAAAGTADIYVGNPAAYSPTGFRWPLAALPAAATFSADQVVVIPLDHLFVVVEGGTAGEVLLVRAEVLDYPEPSSGRSVVPV